jgi:hypothetical protein
VPLVTPRELTNSVPPKSTVVALAVAPDCTSSVPPDNTSRFDTTPEETIAVPPLTTGC